MKKLPNRKSIRLKGYDYSQEGSYFITLCVREKAHIFGKIKNGIMGLNELGIIAQEEWLKTPQIRPQISLGAFIIMPNHMHGIIHIDKNIFQENKNPQKPAAFKSPSQTIGAIIRGYKGATTKRIKSLLIDSPPISTGESQFAPTDGGNQKTNPSQFAPTDGGNQKTNPLQFAPTIEQALKNKIDLSKSIWQRNYYENIIRNERAYHNISNYIWNNPIKWSQDKFHY
jgi:REP element-mobilizing transposase RayT